MSLSSIGTVDSAEVYPGSAKILAPEKPIFLLTIDTEEEWDWDGPMPQAPFSTRNIAEVPAFQAFCRDMGVRPTYFVDHAVCSDKECTDILKESLDKGECDIGAHLHPWCTPPLEEEINAFNSHAINLPADLFKRKIQVLTDQLVAAFGCHPYSYRAGRWGVNGQHLKLLAEAGYRVDSSIRPFFSDKNFSYAHARTRPYWPSFDDALSCDPAQQLIFEVPVTSGYQSPSFERLNALHSKLCTPPLKHLHLIGILWRLRLMRKITVTPEGYSSSDICRCIDAAIARGDRIINMFFHSSDLLPGSTPYVRTQSDKRRFLDCIKHCVEHMRRKHDAEILTMREIRQSLTGAA